MDARSAHFVDVMAAIAGAGILAFVAGAVVLAAGRTSAIRNGRALETQWVAFVPAVLLLIALAAAVVWLVSGGGQWAWGEGVGDWQASARTIAFTLLMLALGLIGLVASGVYGLTGSWRRPRLRRAAPAAAELAGPPAIPTPSGLRLLGLLAPLLAVLLMCWIALSRSDQYALTAQLLYPASLGVGLVLLFDKASRMWGTKSGAETAREWLLCDTLLFLLFLGFLNLRSVAKPEAYAAVLFDLINLVLFFAVFWVLDRKTTRLRFLLAYAYLVILPMLLLAWRAAAGVPAPGAASWWGSVWPFFVLSAAFLLLEAAVAVGSPASSRQSLAVAKDALFVGLYAVLLIVAASLGGHA